MRPYFVLTFVLGLAACLAAAQASAPSDEGSRVLALDNSWNHALESNDAKALDMLLADSFVSVDIDGSMQNKLEFLASLKGPGYQRPRKP